MCFIALICVDWVESKLKVNEQKDLLKYHSCWIKNPWHFCYWETASGFIITLNQLFLSLVDFSTWCSPGLQYLNDQFYYWPKLKSVTTSVWKVEEKYSTSSHISWYYLFVYFHNLEWVVSWYGLPKCTYIVFPSHSRLMHVLGGRKEARPTLGLGELCKFQTESFRSATCICDV